MGEEQSKKPRDDTPAWWHPNGAKMRPISDFPNGKLLIASDRACLAIGSVKKSHVRKIWSLVWEITRISALGIKIELKMPDEVLRRAFALDDGTSASDEEFLRHYGADAAEKGYYIRAGNHLNIPGPGTRHDGDPNISILLDEGIQEFLLQLLDLP